MNKIYIQPEPPGSLKKFRVILPGGKTIRFGQMGSSDYTIHKDPTRMNRYIMRHGGGPRGIRSSRENWTRQGFRTAGFWSRWLLWSSPSLKKAAQNISQFLGIPVVLLK